MTTPRDPDHEPAIWPSAPPPQQQPNYPPPPPAQPPRQQPQGPYQASYPPPPYSPQQPYQQPGNQQPGYPQPGATPPPTPAKHNTKILLICAIVLVLLLGGAGAFFLLRKDSKHTLTLAETKQQIATNAETFLHALGKGDPSVFCKLWDPTDLKAALTQNHISSCAHIELTDPQTRTLYSSIKVTNVARIDVSGKLAVIKASNFTPNKAKDLMLIHESDGRWLVQFFS